MTTSKSLYLIRHAHRDTSQGRLIDNGLSDKGKRQAERLKDYFLKHCKSTPRLVSSPYLRCKETLEPLAKELNVELEISHDLSEHEADETAKQFETRITNFCQAWQESSQEIVLASSHGDWLPECAYQLIGVWLPFKKGSFAHIIDEGDGPELFSLVQTLKPIA